MTFQKSLLLTLVLFVQIFTVAQAATFIMWAEGDGQTLKEAKASAVTALSQQVISKVESSFETKLSVTNEDANRDTTSVKKIKSNLILKGVIYVDEARDGDNIKITAGLDRPAIFSTIDYMKKQLEVEFSILSRDKKNEKLLISDQLTAFISILPGSILNDLENIESWNKKKRVLILKHLFMGRVVFVSNTPNYRVNVDENPVETGAFLEEGNYQFSASAEGRRTMNGSFYASGGETVKIKLDFIKAVSNKKISLTLADEYEYIRDDLADTLSDLGISISSGQNNSLIVKIKDKASDVDGYISHNLKIRIEAYKNGQRVKKVTLKKNFVIQRGEEQTVKNRINRYVKKGTVALMSRIDLSEFFD